jgi:siroheme synthase
VNWAALATAVDTLVVLMGSRALPEVARTLIAHGRAAETPVALIHDATTPRQVTVTTTLGALLDAATAPTLPAPKIAVIGDVVSLRASLGLAARVPAAAVGA